MFSLTLKAKGHAWLSTAAERCQRDIQILNLANNRTDQKTCSWHRRMKVNKWREKTWAERHLAQVAGNRRRRSCEEDQSDPAAPWFRRRLWRHLVPVVHSCRLGGGARLLSHHALQGQAGSGNRSQTKQTWFCRLLFAQTWIITFFGFFCLHFLGVHFNPSNLIDTPVHTGTFAHETSPQHTRFRRDKFNKIFALGQNLWFFIQKCRHPPYTRTDIFACCCRCCCCC